MSGPSGDLSSFSGWQLAQNYLNNPTTAEVPNVSRHEVDFGMVAFALSTTKTIMDDVATLTVDVANAQADATQALADAAAAQSDATQALADAAAAQATADAAIPTAEKGVANGVATLDGSGLVPSAQLPSYVDDVLEYANLAAFPGTGETGKIYVALDTNITYRWSGTVYVQVGGVIDHGGLTGLGDDDHTQYLLVDGSRAMTGSILFSAEGLLVGLSGSDSSLTFNNSSASVLRGVTGVHIAGGGLPGSPNFRVEASKIYSDSTHVFTPGAVGAPSITFDNDEDTGFWSLAPNEIGLTAGGVQRVRFSTSWTYFSTNIDSTGDVRMSGSICNIGATGIPVSGAGESRIYFDSVANKTKISENGGAYVDLISAGVAYTDTVAGNISSGTHGAGITSVATTVTINDADTASKGARVDLFCKKQHAGYTSFFAGSFTRQKGSATWTFNIGESNQSQEIQQGTGKTATFTTDTSTIVLSATATDLTITYNFTTGANANTAQVSAKVKVID